MAAANEEMTITYGAVSIGGSTARKIDGWTRDEQDYTNAWFEFEFVTTAATDAALVSELDTLRAEFRKPRLDFTVTQNGQSYFSRKHSDNTALNTFPSIVKDGDPADTGRSHHFKIRIEYELPADNVSTSFRRGSTINVQYTPSRRRTVTINGIYTANSTDGTTTALAQYSAQIAAYESNALATVSPGTSWEQVGEPQVEFFETNKLLSFTRVYREVNITQAQGILDDADIVDPQLIVIRNRIEPGDSLAGGLVLSGGEDAGGGTGPSQTMAGPGPSQTQTTPTGTVKRPVFVHVDYATSINFANVNLNAKWLGVIRPRILLATQTTEGAAGLILIDEKVHFDDYENRIIATLDLIAYSSGILSQRITHDDVTAYGRVLLGVTEANPFTFYDFQGPAVRQRTVIEEREEVTDSADVKSYVDKLFAVLGSTTNFGSDWVLMTRRPLAAVLRKGLSDVTATKFIAEAKIETTLQYRVKKSPSKADAGGVTGANVITG